MSDRDRSLIEKTASISSTATIDSESLYVGEGARVGENVRIAAKRVSIAAGAVIGDDVNIAADEVLIGFGTVIEQECSLTAIGGPAEHVQIGDFAFLGFRQRVLAPRFRVGDYTTIHNSCLINGYEEFSIGHNGWVGQDSILNCSARLQLGNNVRIGTRSQLWTHVASGELLEGCQMYGTSPLVLEDDVWIVGGAVVSPNLVLAAGSVIMPGSVVTRSTMPRRCYSGVPAVDVTEKVRPYADVSDEERRTLMAGFVDEFHGATDGRYASQIHMVNDRERIPEVAFNGTPQIAILTGDDAHDVHPAVSCFSLRSKRYTKRRSQIEQDFIRFHLGARARFIPVDESPAGQ